MNYLNHPFNFFRCDGPCSTLFTEEVHHVGCKFVAGLSSWYMVKRCSLPGTDKNVRRSEGEHCSPRTESSVWMASPPPGADTPTSESSKRENELEMRGNWRKRRRRAKSAECTYLFIFFKFLMVNGSDLCKFSSIVRMFYCIFSPRIPGSCGRSSIRCRSLSTSFLRSRDSFSDQHIVQPHQLRIRWFFFLGVSETQHCVCPKWQWFIAIRGEVRWEMGIKWRKRTVSVSITHVIIFDADGQAVWLGVCVSVCVTCFVSLTVSQDWYFSISFIHHDMIIQQCLSTFHRTSDILIKRDREEERDTERRIIAGDEMEEEAQDMWLLLKQISPLSSV